MNQTIFLAKSRSRVRVGYKTQFIFLAKVRISYMRLDKLKQDNKTRLFHETCDGLSR